MDKKIERFKRRTPEKQARHRVCCKNYNEKTKRLACAYPLGYGDEEYHQFIKLAAIRGMTNSDLLRLAVRELIQSVQTE